MTPPRSEPWRCNCMNSGCSCYRFGVSRRLCDACWSGNHAEAAHPTAATPPAERPRAINDHERQCPDCQRTIADEQKDYDAAHPDEYARLSTTEATE